MFGVIDAFARTSWICEDDELMKPARTVALLPESTKKDAEGERLMLTVTRVAAEDEVFKATIRFFSVVPLTLNPPAMKIVKPVEEEFVVFDAMTEPVELTRATSVTLPMLAVPPIVTFIPVRFVSPPVELSDRFSMLVSARVFM